MIRITALRISSCRLLGIVVMADDAPAHVCAQGMMPFDQLGRAIDHHGPSVRMASIHADAYARVALQVVVLGRSSAHADVKTALFKDVPDRAELRCSVDPVGADDGVPGGL